MVVKHRVTSSRALSPMTSFNFEPVQLLDIKAEDNPKIDVKDGMLLIHANRNGDRIIISAPLNSVLPSAVSVQTTVKGSSSRRLQNQRGAGAKPLPMLPVSNGREGQNNALSKLTDNDVREMRFMSKDFEYANSFSSKQKMIQDLAKIYCIHWTTVYNIINYKSWKHIKD